MALNSALRLEIPFVSLNLFTHSVWIMNEQSRINAVISYFFLGPLFLLAKKGTPLAEQSVQMHAKKSSKIILITLIFLFLYFFLLKNLLNINFLGIQLDTILLTLIIGGCLYLLLRGAYYAYTWAIATPEQIEKNSQITLPSAHTYTVETEEEKVHLLAGMIPFLWIWLSKKYPSEIMTHSRILGSFFTFFSLASFSLGGSESFIPFFIIGSYILLFVIEWVSLFLQGQFLIIKPFTRIPAYSDIEAFILASLRSIWEFFRIVFWGNARTTFSTLLHEESEKNKIITPIEIPYFMPIGSVWIPFWNIFTLPSLFLEKYREYRNLIVQWLLITMIVAYVGIYLRDFWSPILSLLLFPIIHHLIFSASNTSTHSPGIGTIVEILRRSIAIFHQVKKKESPKEEAKYTYEVEEK